MKMLIAWLFRTLRLYFSTDRAAELARRALSMVKDVRPYIIRAADLAITLTPTQADDAVWNLIIARFPHLKADHPDAYTRTDSQAAADALLIATEFILYHWPSLDVTTARLAAQQGYLDWRESRSQYLEG